MLNKIGVHERRGELTREEAVQLRQASQGLQIAGCGR